MHRFLITIDDVSVRVSHITPDGPPLVRQAPFVLDATALLAAADAAEYGEMLGRAVFAEPGVALLFSGARGAAGSRLPIVLEVVGQRHMALHWERLLVPVGSSRWVEAAADQRFGLGRRVNSAIARPLPDVPASSARTLLVVAAPRDLPSYGLKLFNARAIAGELRAAIGPRHCELLADVPGAVGQPTLDAIVAQLTKRPAAILHIVCHGRVGPGGESVLYLAGHSGLTAPTPLSALRRHLDRVGDAAHRPRLVMLMSCEAASPDVEAALTGAAAQLIAELGTPAVISATEAITVETVRRLTPAFYGYLRRHGVPDRALAEARASVPRSPDAGSLALFSRLDGEPLFQPTRLSWQVRVTSWATLVIGLVAIALAGVYLFAFEPVAEWAADTFAARLLPAPTPILPSVPVLRFAQGEECGPPGLLSEGLAEAAAVAQRRDGRPIVVLPVGQGEGDTIATVVWSCAANGGPINISVELPAAPARPIELLLEPSQLTLSASSSIAAGDFSQAIALYSLGAYDEAWERIWAYKAGELFAQGASVGWLRGNLLVRQGQWEAARISFEEGEALATGIEAVTLALNRATVDILIFEARRARVNAPLPCSPAAPKLLAKALAEQRLPVELRAAVLLAQARQLSICPSADELTDMAVRAPAAIDAAEQLTAKGQPLWAQAQATRALNAMLGPGLPLERPGRVRQAGRAAITAAPELPSPYYVLGQLHATYRRRFEASACFLDYGARAPLAWQRRDALYQAIRAWKWPGFAPDVPRADLTGCGT